MKFSELSLSTILEDALAKESITTPTPIQEKTVPAILEGKSIYISSETGTGKTLAYLLPLLQKLNTATKDLQVIVLTPTHELASQIQDQLLRIKQNGLNDLRTQLLIGSASTKRQLEKLKKKPHIVVGSAGRMLELIKLKKLKVHNVQSMVVDEADNLLFGESLETIQMIIRSMLSDRQLIMCSATNQPETNKVAHRLCEDLVEIHTATNTVSNGIDHLFIEAHENEKSKELCKSIKAFEPEKAIVFTHRNETAKRVAQKLRDNNIQAVEIHGECDKLARVKAISQFKRGKVKVLVASDMAARGLDVKGVTHIFNIDIPTKSKDYLHRAGRTGRAGAQGMCICLMSGEEQKIKRRYERELDITFIKAQVNEGRVYIEE